MPIETAEPTEAEVLQECFDDALDLLGTAAELVACIEGRRRNPSAVVGDLPAIAARAKRLADDLESNISCCVKSRS